MKKLLIFLLLGMFLINFVSAEIFTFDNQVSYDNYKKDVKIKNLFGLGKHYADLKITSHKNLNEPIYVGTGWQRVIIQEIEGKEDYNNFIGTPKFLNKKTGKYEELDYYWEKAVYGDVDKKEEVCEKGYDKYLEKKVDYCHMEVVGTEKKIVDWERFEKLDIKKGEKITIALVVNVKAGDYYDGIPKFFGKEIKEWAEWTSDLDVSILQYFQLNESSGNAIEYFYGDYNGTVSGSVTQGATGKIGTAYTFSSGGYVSISGNSTTSNTWSVSAWVKHTDSNAQVGGEYILFGSGNNPIIGVQENTQALSIYDGSWRTLGGDVCTGSYVHIVIISNGASNYKAYVNNAKVYDSTAGDIDFSATRYIGGNGGTSTFLGSIDEVGLWDRVLTESEVSQLYNNGSGITPPYAPDPTPTVTIVYPTATTYNTNTHDLTYTATSEGTLESCWKSQNNGATNSSHVSYGTNWTGLTAIEGSNTWSVWCNATTGETGNSSISFTVDTTPMIEFSGATPNDYTNQSFNTLFANVTLTETYFNNVTFYLWNSSYDNINTTTFADNTREINWTLPYDDTYTYNATIWTTTNKQNSTETRHLDYDSTEPFVEITYPIGTIDYHRIGDNLEFNWTTNSDADNCWYTLDSGITNNSVTCGTNTTNINITSSSITSLIFYANDTNGNRNSTTTNWSYKIFENGIIYSPSTFETKTETYAINVTANSSLTAVKLMFNNESGLSMTESGSNYWTYSRDVPLGSGLTLFEYTKGIGDIFLNISFKDENTLSHINASIPTSTFTYYLGSGSVNKTLTFSNNTDNLEYNFNGTTGSENLYVIPSVQYRQVSDYFQRIWEPTTRTYNSTQTDQVLYLLSSDDGIYVTYQVVSITNQPIESVEAISTRLVSGETVQIGAGTTDAAGTITFWMNPDFLHTSTFTKSGYDDFILNHFPTQNSYTITLGSSKTTEVSKQTGISFMIMPQRSFLFQNEIHDFSFSLSSTYWELEEFGFNLLRDDGSLIGSSSSTSSSGGTLYLYDVNTSTSESIYMNAYYVIDGETILVNLPRIWKIQSTNGTEYSIWQLSQDLDTYISASLFGFDDFGRRLLSVIILITIVGGLSKRYGIASEGAITGLIFAIVFLLEIGFEFLPQITVPVSGFVLPRGTLTAVTFLILITVLIWEGRH